MTNLQDMFDDITNHSRRYFTHGDEARAKISKAASERQNRPEVKAEISARAKAANARPEVKAKISAANKGRVKSEEELNKLRKPKNLSDEQRANYSARSKLREEQKRLNGYRVSDEARAKISAVVSKRAKKVMTPDGMFNNTKDAGKHFGVGAATIYHRISKYKNKYYFVECQE
jgi:hypothetical protein